MDSLPEPSFLTATKRLKKEVVVGGESFFVRTLGFLDGFRLEKLKTKFTKSDEDPQAKVDAILGILDLALVDKTKTIMTNEVVDVISAILEMNPEFPPLAWQVGRDDNGKKKQELIELQSTIDLYEGRYLAKITALLASTFGWSADYVLRELTGYEVAFFVQEALLVDHARREWDYMLADVGFKKEGDEYKKQPFSPLLWMTKVPKAASEKMREKINPRYLPDGHIVDFGNAEQMKQMGYDKAFARMSGKQEQKDQNEKFFEEEKDYSNDSTSSIGNLRVDR